MITVWCMNTNNHAPQSEVDILERMVDRHLSIDHEFNCVAKTELPGWWGKLNILTSSRKRNLWLDLDVTITGSIDALCAPLAAPLRACKNWANSGHGGIQSSVMYWERDLSFIRDGFNRNDAHWPPRNDLFWDNGQVQWGDQEWLTYLRDTGKLQVEYFDPAHVVSYKYHCRDGLPPDSLVQVFHGKPNPADVNDDWVKLCRV